MKYSYEQIVRNIQLYYLIDDVADEMNVSKILNKLGSIFNHSEVYEYNVDNNSGIFYYINSDNNVISIVSEIYGWTILNRDIFYDLIDSLDMITSREDLYKLVRYYMKNMIGDESIDIECTDYDNRTTRKEYNIKDMKYVRNVKIC